MTRVYLGLALALGLAGAFAWTWFNGRAYERDLQLDKQVRAAVVVLERQGHETIKEVIRYVRIKEKHQLALPDVQRRIADSCTRGLLSVRAQVRAADAGAAAVSEDGKGALGRDPAPADQDDRAWCEQLAEDYAAGVFNTDALGLALGWIRAHGGAPDLP